MAAGAEGVAEHRLFERRLAAVELVLHNQDNREHDILDSDDYYQFEGGLTAAVRTLAGQQPEIYHNDHARPETPRIRTLREEIGRIVRGRAVNPKWLAGVMRHGYKGAFEIAATRRLPVRVRRHRAGGRGPSFRCAVRRLSRRRPGPGRSSPRPTPQRSREIAERFQEAIERGLWRPSRNSAPDMLAALRCRR